ncbi:MAG: hypothetical protein ACRD0O_18855 [Acidimicrobiia bacterium]
MGSAISSLLETQIPPVVVAGGGGGGGVVAGGAVVVVVGGTVVVVVGGAVVVVVGGAVVVVVTVPRHSNFPALSPFRSQASLVPSHVTECVSPAWRTIVVL